MAAIDIPLPNITSFPTPEETTLPAPDPWDSMPAEVFAFLSLSLPLTPSTFHPPDRSTPLQTAGDFKRGPATIMIIRYTATPVGPYDELLLVPGKFTVPGTDLTKLRVSRIYVSNPRSVWNGRKNWNICKKLARFEFTPAAEGSALPYEKLEIYPPGENQPTPFFRAEFTATWFTGLGLPVSTAWSPLDLELVTPPLVEGEGIGECASEEWRRVMPKIWGKTGVVGGRLWGDGVGWLSGEEMGGFWGYGGWIRGNVTFGKSRGLPEADRKAS